MSTGWRNTDSDWGALARSFHWLVALLILAQIIIGRIAEGMALSPAKIDAFVWHKSLGITVLLLALLRLGWRLYDGPPAMAAGVSAIESKLAALSHALLYLLMVAVPLSGWWVSDASRVPFDAFFVVPMPDFISADRDMQERAADVHELLINALIVVASIHVAAALWHHFHHRNGVLTRMLIGRKQ